MKSCDRDPRRVWSESGEWGSGLRPKERNGRERERERGGGGGGEKRMKCCEHRAMQCVNCYADTRLRLIKDRAVIVSEQRGSCVNYPCL